MLTFSANNGFAVHHPLSATDVNLDDDFEAPLQETLESLGMGMCCGLHGCNHDDDVTEPSVEDLIPENETTVP